MFDTVATTFMNLKDKFIIINNGINPLHFPEQLDKIRVGKANR